MAVHIMMEVNKGQQVCILDLHYREISMLRLPPAVLLTDMIKSKISTK
jgi:hypothetical protein